MALVHFRPAAAAAAGVVIAFTVTGANAQGLLGQLFGGGNSSAWQGSWGVEGSTPVITVNGSAVTYEGQNRQTFPVTNVQFGTGKVTFEAGGAAVALTRRSDTAADMVSSFSDQSSRPILLCRSNAPRCP